jgi:hypothetical protein
MLIATRFAESVEAKSPANAEIQRHSNGSIDLDYYVQIGREAHGAAVRGWAQRIAGSFRRFISVISQK